MTSFSPPEILHVNSKKVSCDGAKDDKKAASGKSSAGAVGHPLIYMDMGKNDFVICPYCSKYFTTQKTAPNLVGAANFTKKTVK